MFEHLIRIPQNLQEGFYVTLVVFQEDLETVAGKRDFGITLLDLMP